MLNCSQAKKTRLLLSIWRTIRRRFLLFADVGRKMRCLPAWPRSVGRSACFHWYLVVLNVDASLTSYVIGILCEDDCGGHC